MAYTLANDNSFLDIKNAHLRVTGNVHATAMKIGAIEVVPGYSLERTANVGNTTTSTIQFTNPTTSLVTSGNVEVGGELTVTGNVSVGKDLTVTGNVLVSDDLTVTGNVSDLNIVSNVNMLHTSNTASIKLNSNVVTEFPRSKKLIKYPRVAMTSASQDGYVTSGSADNYNSSGFYTYNAFNNIQGNEGWHGGAGNSTTVYHFIANSGGSIYDTSKGGSLGGNLGEWLKLELPLKIVVDSLILKLRSANQHPKDFKILGSNDDVNWDILKSVTNNSSSGSQKHTIGAITGYKYIAMLVTRVHSTGVIDTVFSELEYYGTPEYDPEAHGVDVVVKSVPNVPNTDWLEVYYDGKDYSGTPSSITDKSGNNITATANNITIDATYNSFEFTQSPKSNIIAENVTFVSGDESHSVVLWVRLKNGNANNLLFDYRVAGGTSTTGAATGLYILNSNKRLQFFHQGTDKSVDLDFEQNRWYHITGTYAGGGGFTGSKIYIDGVDVGGAMAGVNSPLVLPTTGTITIGDYLYAGIGLGDGSIANFRLFNRALTSDEIYQLYAYQKEYFGHGDLSMTLKAGRVGIGTSEPRAALDVRGDIIGGCPAFFSATRTSGTLTSPATVVFDSLQVSKGGGFNTSTGEYTVPLSGYYFIGHHSASSTTAHYQPKLRVNDVDFNNYLSRNYSSGGSNNRPVSFSLIGYLNAGDRATIYINVGVMHSAYAGFTMYYLSS